MYLFSRFYGYLSNHKELRYQKNEIVKWLKNYIETETDLSFKYKLKTKIKLAFPRLYAWRKKILKKRDSRKS